MAQNGAPPAYDEATTSLMSTETRPNDYKTRYALLSLSRSDRVRLIRFPKEIAARIAKEVMPMLWPKGIQDVRRFDENLEVKLRGNPLAHGSDEEKIAIRQLLLGVLDALAREGWGVYLAAGGLGRVGDYDEPGGKGREMKCLKLSSGRKGGWY